MFKRVPFCAAVLLLLLAGCAAVPGQRRAANIKGADPIRPLSDAKSFSSLTDRQNDRSAGGYNPPENYDLIEHYGVPHPSIEEIQFSEEEDCPARALKVVDQMLGHPRPVLQPFHLGLVDLTLDGVPELLFCNDGQWGGNCQIFDLSGDHLHYLAGIPWPIRVNAIYQKETGLSTAWRVEGYLSHGFVDHVMDQIVCWTDGQLDKILCENEVILDMDHAPFSSAFTVEHNDVLLELVSFDCEEFSEEEIQQQMAGSLYNAYLKDGWTLDETSWVFEEALYAGDEFYRVWPKVEPDELKTRIDLLYNAWLQRQT